jgi:hypothetical protein
MRSRADRSIAIHLMATATANGKSFLLLFFKKEALPSLHPSPAHPSRQLIAHESRRGIGSEADECHERAARGFFWHWQPP